MPPAPQLGLTARATVDRVVDGDTIDVSLRLPVRIRLIDCWAPEVTGRQKIFGEAAKAALADMLPEGTTVVVNVPSGEADKLGDVLTFGRALGHVWDDPDGPSIAELMIAAGYATEAKP